MNKQAWKCPRCQKRGYVVYCKDEGVFNVANMIARSHSKISPECDQDPLKLKVFSIDHLMLDGHRHCAECGRAYHGDGDICIICEIDKAKYPPDTPWPPTENAKPDPEDHESRAWDALKKWLEDANCISSQEVVLRDATLGMVKKLRPGIRYPITTGEFKEKVDWFAREMEGSLENNDDKGGWEDCTDLYLITRLEEEVHELKQALVQDRDNIVWTIEEAADVANFAMFIADNARARDKK